VAQQLAVALTLAKPTIVVAKAQLHEVAAAAQSLHPEVVVYIFQEEVAANNFLQCPPKEIQRLLH
jgi:hypothetical protein